MRYRKLENPSRIVCYHGHRHFGNDVFSDAAGPCPFSHRRCAKENPVCEMSFEMQDMITCPSRFEEKQTVFKDALRRVGYWGDRFRLRREVKISNSFFDFVLSYPAEGERFPFVFVEIQALDSSGSSWWEVKRLKSHFGIQKISLEPQKHKPLGPSWQMSVKTLLHQILKKSRICTSLAKPLFVVVQDGLWNYIAKRYRLPKDGFGVTWLVYGVDDEGSLRLKAEYSMSFRGILDLVSSERIEDPSPEQILSEFSDEKKVEVFHG